MKTRKGWFRESRRHADAYYKGRRGKRLERMKFLGQLGGKKQQLFMYADVPEKLEKPLITKEEFHQRINEYLKSRGKRPLTVSESSRFFSMGGKISKSKFSLGELISDTVIPNYTVVDSDDSYFYSKKEGIGVIMGYLDEEGNITKLVVEKFGERNKLFSGKNAIKRAKEYLERK